tara:strand:+ start:949 stop:1473 length:525 start_codon:yes stop_codon:yes gene_type:complete
MNENLKNRIVGVAIIIALAVIIIPILFQGTGQKVLKFKEIKNQEEIVFKYSEKVEELYKDESITIDLIKKNIDTRIVSYKDLNNIKNNKSISKTWVIKVGSYSNKKNAEKQIQDLEEKKHQSFILKSTKNGKTLYSVNVGPFFSVDDLKKNYSNLIKNKNYSESYILESNLNNK